MQRIEPYLDELKKIINKLAGNKEGFLNQFDFNETCLLLTLVFVVIFMYKKEIMNMLNLK